MRTPSLTRSIGAAALALLAPLATHAQLQPNARANGETLAIQYIGGSLANYQAIIAEKKGMCEKHGFKCENKAINAGPLALQALVGKSVDVALTGTDTAVANIVQGGDLIVVATLRQNSPFVVATRADVAMPNKAKGYPAIMQDFKGKTVGVTSRGAATETNVIALLQGAGMQASDVTFVPVGGPATAFQALTVGKQIDFLSIFEPLPTLCAGTKACEIVIDLTTGTFGPKSITAMNGAMITLLMRREMVESNPKLVHAYIAAMSEATKWAQDPANFEEVLKIYEPIVNFGNAPNAGEMRRRLVKIEIASSSPGMETSRPALKAIVDFALANKTISTSIDPVKLVWKEAP